MSKFLRIALCQQLVLPSKLENLIHATRMITQAKEKGADLVVLPECFNSPYGTQHFPEYAESIRTGETRKAMAEAAKNNKVWLVAGSIPERDDSNGKLYNTSMTFNPEGDMVAFYRKMHLFRLFTEKVAFDESETLSAGNCSTIFSMSTPQAGEIKVGCGICFDVRYGQLALHYAENGTSLIVYPGAFNMYTGPKHWQLMGQARAIEAQQYVLLCSCARDAGAGYVAWGHSMVISPNGDVVAALEEREGLLVTEIDLGMIKRTRAELPILSGTRRDLYSLVFKEAE